MPAAGRGRPVGTKIKPARDALELVLKDSQNREALRRVWQKVLNLALQGEQWAARELFDRTDGKVAQALIGGDDEDNQLVIQVVSYTKEIVQPVSSPKPPTDKPSE